MRTKELSERILKTSKSAIKLSAVGVLVLMPLIVLAAVLGMALGPVLVVMGAL